VNLSANPIRRGAALLLVLAALILSTVSCAIAAHSAAALKATRRADQAARVADDLLIAVEAPIQHWLSTSAPAAVLPPVANEPRFDVLHDVVRVGAFDAEIIIAAFDQLGMVPWQLVNSASPIAAVLPPEVERVMPREMNSEVPVGLDAFVQADLAPGWRVYPLAERSNADYYAIGALVATHNDSGGDSGGESGGESGSESGGRGRINVNTAPRKLLEAAMLDAGRGGIESMLDSRENGKAASFASHSSRHAQQSITLVSTSDVWSFRIDISVGPITRSWWCVYSSSQLVQRLVIPE